MATVVFSGGVGGSRFLSGLCRVMDQKDITVISNIGDDTEFYGLYVCPDIDIVLYTLAGRINPKTGWGLEGDTFQVLDALKKLGHPCWFNLGDQDLATHLHRTMRLKEGWPLSKVTAELARLNGLELTVLPSTDQRVETRFDTPMGDMPFQEYMVKHRWQVDIEKIRFVGAETASPAPGVLEALESAERIILAPSNPYISIGAILAVPGIREALEKAKCPVIAVSPIVGGKAIKGPAARLLEQFGQPVSPVGVARVYQGLVSHMVIDNADRELAGQLEDMGIVCGVTDTMMDSFPRKEALVRFVLEQK